jgi:hypothetical protein
MLQKLAVELRQLSAERQTGDHNKINEGREVGKIPDLNRVWNLPALPKPRNRGREIEKVPVNIPGEQRGA